MSRTIINNHTDTTTQSETQKGGGKVVVTKCKNTTSAFLIKDNRIKVMAPLTSDSFACGNIYIAKVDKIVKNVGAAFVKLDLETTAFLPLEDAPFSFITNRKPDNSLKVGDELVVQILKEASKNKLCVVTTKLTISNSVAAINIGAPNTGISKKIQSPLRQELKALGDKVKEELEPVERLTSFGFIIRTEAASMSKEEIEKGLRDLWEEFKGVLDKSMHKKCYSLVRKEDNPLFYFLEKMVFFNEYDKIVTDNPKVYESALEYMESKSSKKEVSLYKDDMLSLDKLFGLSSKCDVAFNRRVWLKSGGFIVIDTTEAMTVIDVNSGKYESSQKKSVSDAKLKVNLEACDEIILQLRLRNISGIIMVDFINMPEKSHDDKVMTYLNEAFKKEKIHTRVVDMTALGIVEITRAKSFKPIAEMYNKK